MLLKYSEEKELQKMRQMYVARPYRDANLPQPEWIRKDALSRLYEEQAAVFAQGQIYYAQIVQANTVLYKFFPQTDCPAMILYSPDDAVNQHPELLAEIAQRLYAYKGMPLMEVPQACRAIVQAITDEHDRRSERGTYLLNDGTEVAVFFTTIMVFRKHLPYRQLIGGLLPVVAMPWKLESAFILPKQYWSKSFLKKHWNG